MVRRSGRFCGRSGRSIFTKRPFRPFHLHKAAGTAVPAVLKHCCSIHRSKPEQRNSSCRSSSVPAVPAAFAAFRRTMDPPCNQRSIIGWEKLHEIALGIAKGIDYLHQGCNQRILHFDIKPHNILLDQNLNPKVADFGLAKLCSKEKSVVTMTAARGTIGYIAPEVFSRNFGKVSYKSDIYSFGMLLLDMVGGRRNFHARAEDSSQVYFPEWMYNQLDKGEDIAIQIEKEDESKIVKRLTIVGLWCIQWYPADRPSMKVVIQMLEGENMPIMPPNPFAASTPADASETSSQNIVSSDFSSSFKTANNSN